MDIRFFFIQTPGFGRFTTRIEHKIGTSSVGLFIALWKEHNFQLSIQHQGSLKPITQQVNFLF